MRQADADNLAEGAVAGVDGKFDIRNAPTC